MSLNGSDTTTGGSIIMPIDIKTEATTRSMIRNGRNSREPTSNVRFNSEMIKGGPRMRSDISSGVVGGGSFDRSMNSLRSFSRTFFIMKPRSGTDARCSASSTLIWLATSGLMPSSYDFCSTGPITKAVRNIASATITVFGGAVAVPIAVRSSDSTTTIRGNDVIMIRIGGAIDSTVSSAINWIERSVTPPLPWPRLILISCANAGSTSDPAATISVAKNKTLRGKDADLTKATSDDPAGMPSRLPNSQTRSSAVSRQPGVRPAVRRGGQGGSAAAQ